MRFLLLLLGIVAATTAVGTRVEAQNYPWCAILDTGDAANNCGFVSREQCMATVSGIGGFCQQDDWYKPPLAVARQRGHIKLD